MQKRRKNKNVNKKNQENKESGRIILKRRKRNEMKKENEKCTVTLKTNSITNEGNLSTSNSMRHEKCCK